MKTWIASLLLLPALLSAQPVPESGTEVAQHGWRPAGERPLRLMLQRQPDWERPVPEGVRELWGGPGFAPTRDLVWSLETRLGRDEHRIDPATRAFLRLPPTRSHEPSGWRHVLRMRLGPESELQLRPRRHTLALLYSVRW